MGSRSAVTARNLHKTFDEVIALDGVNLDVAQGQVHGLIGPNGAGKTTLLGLLLGLSTADSGTLEILGCPVGGPHAPPDGVAGFVDGPGLYPALTARQNLAALTSLRGTDDTEVANALAQVGLTDVADDRVRGFSLGMRQRLGLSAALLTPPRVLVLDEPANGLDPAGTRDVRRVLAGLAASGTTIILSSHRMDDLAALCDEVTVLAAGRVMFTGTVDTLAGEIGVLDYRLRTSDPVRTRHIAAELPQVRVLTEQRRVHRHGADTVVVRSSIPALDELVTLLVRRGVAVRELAPVVAPLEAAFLALTEHPPTVVHPAPAVIHPAPAGLGPPHGVAHPASTLRTYRFELLKLLTPWRLRVLLGACWVGPALFVALVSQQSSLPSDTVFGRWMGQTGWAGALVVLSFGGSWALPLLTSVVAGDVFAVEDRLGTWRHLLLAVRSPRRIFAAKALASLTLVLLLTVGLAVSAVAGGLVAIGPQPLVGLSGQSLAPGSAAAVVGLAWLYVLAPTLAFAAVGLLGSVALGRSPMGLLVPALLALVLQLAQLLPLPVAVRLALPSYAFVAWQGLFTEPVQTAPLTVGLGVSLLWALTATALAYRLFLRRDFTNAVNDGFGRGVTAATVLPLVVLMAVTVGVVTAATPASGTGTGIAAAKVQTSVAVAFAHLYRKQAQQLQRPDVTEEQLQTTASCDKGGARTEDRGPGNDWRCVVSWRIPGAVAVGSALYQLDVAPDGHYVADGDGPQPVNGFFLVRTPTGDAPNPLWQFDASVDLLGPAPKG